MMPADQANAFAALRSLAAPHRFRVMADREGWPIIPGRRGQIEWHDGTLVAVYTNRPRMIRQLVTLPGAVRHQIGDDEARVLIPQETVPEAARVIRARHRRTHGASAEILARARERARALHRATSRLQERSEDATGGEDA